MRKLLTLFGAWRVPSTGAEQGVGGDLAGRSRELKGLRRRRLGVRALAVGAALVVAIGGQAVTPSSASAAAFDCDFRFTTPTQLGSSVYSLVEINCNQTAALLTGSVALYRNGDFVGSVYGQEQNRSYLYELNLVSCEPGDYHAMGFAAANHNGGAPDYFENFHTPTVTMSC